MLAKRFFTTFPYHYWLCRVPSPQKCLLRCGASNSVWREGHKRFPKGPPFAYVFWKNFQRVPPLLMFFEKKFQKKLSKGKVLAFSPPWFEGHGPLAAPPPVKSVTAPSLCSVSLAKCTEFVSKFKQSTLSSSDTSTKPYKIHLPNSRTLTGIITSHQKNIDHYTLRVFACA